MLSLVGLGLSDEKDLTLKGIEIARSSDKVYIELYTGFWHGNLENLEKIVGKKIEVLKRKDLEDESRRIVEEARNGDVVLFVQGDPLVATTHSSLILEARRLKIKSRVVHNASIVSAIAETGLHIYKFGQTVTIPFLEKTNGKLPQSVYEAILENKNLGLHTLCLLDVVAEEKRYMMPRDAVRILLELEKANNKKLLSVKEKIVFASELGGENQEIKYVTLSGLIDSDACRVPSALIILGKLHFTEEEFLNLL